MAPASISRYRQGRGRIRARCTRSRHSATLLLIACLCHRRMRGGTPTAALGQASSWACNPRLTHLWASHLPHLVPAVLLPGLPHRARRPWAGKRHTLIVEVASAAESAGAVERLGCCQGAGGEALVGGVAAGPFLLRLLLGMVNLMLWRVRLLPPSQARPTCRAGDW